MVGMLSWYLYVCKYKLTEAVYTRHQCWCVSVVGGIEMKNITSSHCHRLANPWSGPAMGNSKQHDKFTTQITNFRGGEADIMRNQLATDFLNGAVPSEQGLAYKNEQVIGNIAMFRNQALQRFGVKGTVTVVTEPNGLAGNKRPSHTEYGFTSGLLHLELPATTRTQFGLRTKMDDWWTWE